MVFIRSYWHSITTSVEKTLAFFKLNHSNHNLAIVHCTQPIILDLGNTTACLRCCGTLLLWLSCDLNANFESLPSDFFSHQVQITSNGVNSTELSFERPPSILVPLKVHTPPKGYQLYMTCAVRGCPTPTVSWYLNDICINSDSNYYMTNSFGVCSMYILRVRSKDSGDYKVVAVNPLGKAECSTKLTVRGKV